MTHSVVKNKPATLAALSNATRIALAVSITPILIRLPKASIFAL